MVNKKWMYLLVLFFLIVITGCNQNSSAPAQTPSTSNNQTKSAPVEIEFWYGLGGQLGENVEDFISQFNSSQDEVIVKGIAQGNYSETYQALQAAIASKTAPAVVLLTHDAMYQLASRELLAPLDGYMSSDFNKDDFVQAFINQGVIDGATYSLPLFGTTQVMYYRHDFFEEASVTTDAFKTWEDLYEAAQKLTVREGSEVKRYGWEPMWGSGNMIDASLSRGGEYVSADGTEVMIDSPEWVETWEFFRKAIHEDEVMRIHHGGQGWEYWYNTIDDVIQGRAAGYTGSSGDQGDLDFSIVSAHPQPGWRGHAAAPHATAQTVSIPAITSESKREAAFKFMEFFTSPEMTAEWSMRTGYIAVRQSAKGVPAFQAFAAENPQILVPLQQAETATPPFIDPTGGVIYDELSKAVDRVQIEGISAEVALKEAKQEAQKALDKALGK